MDRARQEKLDEFLTKIAEISRDTFEKIFESEVFNKLLRQINEKCNVSVDGLMLGISLNENMIDIAFDLSIAAPNKESAEFNQNEIASQLKITEEDSKFAKNFKIRFDDEDKQEIEDTYLNKVPLDINTSQTDPFPIDNIDDTNVRNITEVSTSILFLAKKLNLNYRKIWTRAFHNNALSKLLGVQFIKEDLRDDGCWLKNIKKIINKVHEKSEKNKAIELLVLL